MLVKVVTSFFDSIVCKDERKPIISLGKNERKCKKSICNNSHDSYEFNIDSDSCLQEVSRNLGGNHVFDKNKNNHCMSDAESESYSDLENVCVCVSVCVVQFQRSFVWICTYPIECNFPPFAIATFPDIKSLCHDRDFMTFYTSTTYIHVYILFISSNLCSAWKNHFIEFFIHPTIQYFSRLKMNLLVPSNQNIHIAPSATTSHCRNKFSNTYKFPHLDRINSPHQFY